MNFVEFKTNLDTNDLSLFTAALRDRGYSPKNVYLTGANIIKITFGSFNTSMAAYLGICGYFGTSGIIGQNTIEEAFDIKHSHSNNKSTKGTLKKVSMKCGRCGKSCNKMYHHVTHYFLCCDECSLNNNVQ